MNNSLVILIVLIFIGFLVRIEYGLKEVKQETRTIVKRVEVVEEPIIKTQKPVKYTARDLDCLTKNIYYEAGVEDDLGKYAVAHVTLNRMKLGYWGKNVCRVVYARDQFSWTRKRRLQKPNINLFARCRKIAREVFEGNRVRGLDRSLFYHADYIKTPNWVDNTQRITKIGQHIFYNRARDSWLEITSQNNI